MFQNPTIAKNHGMQIEADLKSEGVPAHIAEAMGRRAAVNRGAELDKWVMENVGLD